jgi:hypothetical protein
MGGNAGGAQLVQFFVFGQFEAQRVFHRGSLIRRRFSGIGVAPRFRSGSFRSGNS